MSAISSSGCGGCFACGSSQVVRVDKSRRHFEDQVKNLFKLADQLGEGGLPRAPTSKDRDPCAQCLRDVKEVWELSEEIHAIQRDMKEIIQKMVGRRGRGQGHGRGQGQGGCVGLRGSTSSNKGPVAKKRRQEYDDDPDPDPDPESDDDDHFTVRIKEEIEIDDIDLGDTILGILSPEGGSRDCDEGSTNDIPEIDPDYTPGDEKEGGLNRPRPPPKPLVPLLGRDVVVGTTRNGNQMVVVDGYQFHYHRPGANKLLWVCAYRKMKKRCSARISTTTDPNNIQLLDEIGLPHLHPPPDEASVAFQNLKAKIISEAISLPGRQRRKVVEKYSEELKKAGHDRGIKYQSLVDNLLKTIWKKSRKKKESRFSKDTMEKTNENSQDYSEFV